MGDLGNTALLLGAFLLVALASDHVGKLFRKLRLPLITGFLFTGIIAGPVLLGLVPEEARTKLRFIDHISLAIIAFAAGSELDIRELRGRLKSISYVTLGLVFATFTATAAAVFLLADHVPFMSELGTAGRVAVAILAGSVLIARSPSSAMAIVTELRAQGAMTRTMLGVTVIMDVLVIVLFSVNSEIAGVLLTAETFRFEFALLVLGELALSVGAGVVLAALLRLVLILRMPFALKAAAIVLCGWAVFFLAGELRHVTGEALGFEVFLEPLLICVVGGFVVANFTARRNEFAQVILDVAPPIYVAFFTFTGASLDLGVLVETWRIALVLFFARLVAVTVGSFGGGVVAGERREFNRVSWMAYVTQAGVALGLAKEASVEFPQLGTPFATIIIAVIVLNQLVGPPLLKWALRKVGEAYKKPERRPPREHAAVIFGLEDQSVALARLLGQHGWKARIASRKARDMEREIAATDVTVQPIAALDEEALRALDVRRADAVVLLLSEDESLRVSELVRRQGIDTNLIARLHGLEKVERFRALGVQVVNPATAMLGLLDHSVRSPSVTAVFLGEDSDQDVIDVEVRNPALQDVPVRDLRLPLDTLVISIHRHDRMLVSHGYTPLKVGDRVTVIGSSQSLEAIAARFES